MVMIISLPPPLSISLLSHFSCARVATGLQIGYRHQSHPQQGHFLAGRDQQAVANLQDKPVMKEEGRLSCKLFPSPTNECRAQLQRGRRAGNRRQSSISAMLRSLQPLKSPTQKQGGGPIELSLASSLPPTVIIRPLQRRARAGKTALAGYLPIAQILSGVSLPYGRSPSLVKQQQNRRGEEEVSWVSSIGSGLGQFYWVGFQRVGPS